MRPIARASKLFFEDIGKILTGGRSPTLPVRRLSTTLWRLIPAGGAARVAAAHGIDGKRGRCSGGEETNHRADSCPAPRQDRVFVASQCVFHANRAAVPRQSEQAFHANPSGDSTAKRALRTWRRGVSSFTPSRLRWSNHFGACASIRLIA